MLAAVTSMRFITSTVRQSHLDSLGSEQFSCMVCRQLQIRMQSVATGTWVRWSVLVSIAFQAVVGSVGKYCGLAVTRQHPSQRLAEHSGSCTRQLCSSHMRILVSARET